MTQNQVIVLCFRIVLISAFLSLSAFVAQYTRLAPWWRDQIGRTIVVKTVLLALVLIPSILALFFKFSPLGTRVASWFDIGVFALITPVMIWRIVVWQKVSELPGGNHHKS